MNSKDAAVVYYTVYVVYLITFLTCGLGKVLVHN